MDANQLKKHVGDVHDLKAEYIEDGTPVSHFDVQRDR